MTGGLLIGACVLAIAMAFLLSGMEAGVFTLSRFRIRRLARQGDRRAQRLQHYLEHPEHFLWTILVGNTLSAWVVITVVALRLERWLGTRPGLFVAGVVVVLFLLYLFADLLPKVLFRRFPNRLCLAGVGPFGILHAVLAPIVGAAEIMSGRLVRLAGGQSAFSGRLLGSRAELRQAIQESSTSLTREELAMINRILDLQKLRVRDVMTPMDRAATLESSDTVRALIDLARERPVSYLPLWKEASGTRRVLGVIALTHVLYDEHIGPTTPLESLVQPALFIDETTRLEDALRLMQRSRQRLAVVLDAQRHEIGVVTLNDILRAMFGDVGL